MSHATFPEGACCCTRCRKPLTTGRVACDTCAPLPVESTAAALREPESLFNSPFVVALTLLILFLFLWQHDPAAPNPARDAAMDMRVAEGSREADEYRRFVAELKQDYLDPWADAPSHSIASDQIRAMLEDRLHQIDLDPRFSPEQRRDLRAMIDRALGTSDR